MSTLLPSLPLRHTAFTPKSSRVVSSYFQALAGRIQAEWIRTGFSLAAFPVICAEALARAPAADFVTVADVVDWGLAHRLPQQLDPEAKFGEPPLTVYATNDFVIDVNFWLSSTTAIHSHGFSGAFQVLAGRSLHTQFSFVPNTTFSEHMATGAIAQTSCELLRERDTRKICSRDSIHSLFHLEQPSATVVVRTRQDADARTQFTFLLPNVAINPFHDREMLGRRRQLLALVQRTRPQCLSESCLRAFASADAVGRFAILRHGVALSSPEDGDRLIAAAALVDETAADIVRSVVANDRREAFIIGRRAIVTDPMLRFFLAILLNVDGRLAALDVVRATFPDVDPASFFLRAAQRLSDLNGGDGEPALGFELDAVTACVLDGLLRNVPERKLLRHVSIIASRFLDSTDRAEVRQLIDALRSSEMFCRLLAE
jgi:hypothetical protein